MTTEYETIRYERDGAALRLSLNRPDRKNALSPTMLGELRDAFARAEGEREVAVIVLRGAGDAFSAGADLAGMAAEESFYDKYRARASFPELFLAMERSTKVILAAVNGTCIAGGFGLMMAADLAIARSGAKLGTPELARGLFPYMISSLILRGVPRRAAMEIMLLGELFSAERAAELGVVNRVVPADEFDAAVEAWVKKIAGYSPAVLALGRRALTQQAGMPLDGALAYLQGLLSVNVMMEDAAEGISAFFDKRQPSWKGR